MAETLQPGAELDARVHRDVMGRVWDESRCRVCGWPLARSDADFMADGCIPDNCSMRPAPRSRADAPPAYSTDIATAWTVAEKMGERGFHARICTPFEPDMPHFVGFTPHGVTGWNGRPDFSASGESAPLAICRAALVAAEESTQFAIQRRNDGGENG